MSNNGTITRNRIEGLLDQAGKSPAFKRITEDALCSDQVEADVRRERAAVALAEALKWFCDEEPGLHHEIQDAEECFAEAQEIFDDARRARRDAHGRLRWARLECDRRQSRARRELRNTVPASIGEFLTWLAEEETNTRDKFRTWERASGLLSRLTGRPRYQTASNSDRVEAKLGAITTARDWCRHYVENEFFPFEELRAKLAEFRADIERMPL
jgi:hypothetical protein